MLEALKESRNVMKYIDEHPDTDDVADENRRSYDNSSYLVRLSIIYDGETESQKRVDVQAMRATLKILAMFSYALIDQPKKYKRLNEALKETKTD